MTDLSSCRADETKVTVLEAELAECREALAKAEAEVQEQSEANTFLNERLEKAEAELAKCQKDLQHEDAMITGQDKELERLRTEVREVPPPCAQPIGGRSPMPNPTLSGVGGRDTINGASSKTDEFVHLSTNRGETTICNKIVDNFMLTYANVEITCPSCIALLEES